MKNGAQILREAFLRLRARNPNFSLRAAAKNMGLSPGYLSKVLNGKQRPTPRALKSIYRGLKIDEVNQVRHENLISSENNSRLGPRDGNTPFLSAFDLLPRDSDAGTWLFEKWYRVVLLDGLTLSGSQVPVRSLAKQLGLTDKEVRESFRKMVQLRLATIDANLVLRKATLKIRYPTVHSRALMRHFHAQMIGKSIEALETQTTDEDFERRLIAGITVACDPANLERARKHLHEAIYKAVEILQEGGSSTAVYQINLQLIPLLQNLMNNNSDV